jgi:hypothetical protein
MEESFRTVLAKIASVDIKVEKKKGRTSLVVIMAFALEKGKTEHVTLDFAHSNLRFFNFVTILLHVVAVNKWSKLAGEKVFVLWDEKSIYRISNARDEKLFLDFAEFFDVDC